MSTLRGKYSLELFWIMVGQAVSMVGGIAAVKLLTSVLTPDQYGFLAIGLTLPILSQQLWAGPIGQAIGRYVAPSREKGTLGELLRTGRSLYILCSLIYVGILAVLIIASYFSGIIKGELLPVLIVGTILSIVEAGFALIQIVRVQLRQRKEVAGFQAFFALLRPLLAVGLIIVAGQIALAAIWGYLLATTFVSFLQYRCLRNSGDTVGLHNSNLARRLLRFSYPYLSWGLLSWLTLSGDRWLLVWLTHTETVGFYVAALQVGTIIPTIIGQVSNTFISPVLNDRIGYADNVDRIKKAVGLLNRMLLLLLAVGSIGFLAIYFTREHILTLLTSPIYRVMAYAVPWFFLGGLFNQLAQFCFSIGPMLMRPKAFLIPRSAAYIVTICLMVLLTKYWGLNGMIAAYCLGAFLHFTVTGIASILIYRRFMSDFAQPEICSVVGNS